MRRSLISLVAGLAMAVLAVILMTSYFSPDKGLGKAKGDGPVRVVVAARDMPFGTTIIRDYVKFTNWPSDSVPEGAFTSIDALLVNGDGSGGSRIVMQDSFAGEPILAKKISGFGEKPTLSRKVDINKRAYSVRVNDVSGVAGFLLPGDRVDIILTRAADNDSRQANLVTDVILQNIEILGIDQLTDEAAAQPKLARTVTVEVSPDQAQKLALAQKVGSLSLTLRSYANNAQTATTRISTGDLVPGLLGDIEATKDAPVGRRIAIRRGMQLVNEHPR